MDVDRPESLKNPVYIPRKTLMGAGPSNCSPRVLNAMRRDVIGHMHEEVFQVMNEIKEGIRYIFQTKNELTLAISASGHTGLEAIFSNILEANDKVLICCNGIWGMRALTMAKKLGANAVLIHPSLGPGDNFSIDVLETAIKNHKPKLLFIVQGESSTGVWQPLEGLGDICERYDCLLAVDTVVSLCSVPFFMDKWKVDAVYTGSQKAIGAPPGITPISFSIKAEKVISSRKTPVPFYYLDMTMLGQQWNCYNTPRLYHHTTCSNLLFGLREALAQIADEGLENVQRRHKDCSRRLQEGLKEIGFQFFVKDPVKRLPTVTTLVIPDNLCWKDIISFAMKRYNLEIAGGLGPTAGKVLRVGVMGYNATPEKVDLVLKVLREAKDYATSQKAAKL